MAKQSNLDYEISYQGKQAAEEVLRDASIAQISPIKTFGSPGDEWTNRLIFGDNLPVLRAFLDDPAVCGKVRLIYIDPPYSTRQVFQGKKFQPAYSDTLSGAAYLEFVRKRLILLRELLADDGSIYVHLDTNKAFPVKVIMDEVFGPANFRNWITRKKSNRKNYTRKTYGNMQDFILFYTKSDRYVWNRSFEERGIYSLEERFPKVEQGTGRRHALVPIHARGIRNGATGQPWRGMMPPEGKHWMYTPDKLDKFDARGEIYWSPTGNPRRKIYEDQDKGVPVQDIWLDLKDAHNQNIAITGYPTEKNPEILRRIIEASSNEGDLVLDCFVGSGTTLAVAGELGRGWIGIDNSKLAIFISLKRVLGSRDNGHRAPPLSQLSLPDEKNQRSEQKGIHLASAPFVLFTSKESAEADQLNNTPRISTRWSIDGEKKTLSIDLRNFVSEDPVAEDPAQRGLDLLGMVLVDRHYDGGVFKIDDVFLGNEVVDADGVIKLDSKPLGPTVALVLYDIYGNEIKKEMVLRKEERKLAKDPLFRHSNV